MASFQEGSLQSTPLTFLSVLCLYVVVVVDDVVVDDVVVVVVGGGGGGVCVRMCEYVQSQNSVVQTHIEMMWHGEITLSTKYTFTNIHKP